MTRSPLTEAAFQRQVIDLAHLFGWLVQHTRPARTSKGWRTPIAGDPGYPDLTLAKGGLLLIPELKVGNNQPSPQQRRWLEALAAVREVRSCVWRPGNWDEIEAILRGGRNSR